MSVLFEMPSLQTLAPLAGRGRGPRREAREGEVGVGGPRALERLHNNNRIPGESRDPLQNGSGADQWIPAFAGNAVIFIVVNDPLGGA